MPHVSSSGGDDLASSDEVKVYKDEGEEENRSSENLAEDKVVLVTETEEGKTSDGQRDRFDGGSKDRPPVNGDVKPHRPIWNPLISPYPYTNGATLSGLSPLTSLWSHYSNDRPFGSPPPAHMGIPPIDPKGWPRSLALPPGQFPHPFYPPDLSTAMQWGGPGGYPMPSSGLRGPYPPLSSSPLSRFSPGLFPPHPGLPPGCYPGLVSPGTKQELSSMNPDHPHHPSHRAHTLDYGLAHSPSQRHDVESERTKQIPRVKKPLNAFMLFMKEMRPKVIEECSLKESAAINQILGRKWHALDRAEQSKYYEMARKEKELHLQLYPGWSARDNYGTHSKNKKKRKGPGGSGSECDFNTSKSDSGHQVHSIYANDNSECINNPKKCRARFGLDQQNQWCKPCRRKKKCIRFLEEGGVYSDEEEDNNNTGVPSVSSNASDRDSSPGPAPSQHSPAPRLHTAPHTSQQRQLHLQLPPPPPLYQPYDMFMGPKPATLSAPPTMLAGADSKPNFLDLRPLPEMSRGPDSAPSRDRPSLTGTSPRLSSVTPNMVLAT